MNEGQEAKQQLQAAALKGGADLFGVADLTPAREFVVAQGGEYLGRFPRAISIGFALSPSVVDGLADPAQSALAQTYHEFIYNVVNPRLNEVALGLTQSLARQGFLAYLVPASQRTDDANDFGVFSHKLAAHLGGLGFIGRSCMLVNPRFGARVRLATVLTDAPLPADSPASGTCGDCRRCVDVCPPHAFSGLAFRREDAREARMNASVCRRYLEHRAKKIGRSACGLCVYVCDAQPG